MRVTGRFAESEDPILFASYGEVDKCEFIKVNAPEDAWEAWSSTDDGAGLLVKADALREQAREVLVSAARFPHSRAAASLLSPDLLLPICPPPARPPQGQEVRLEAKKEPEAENEPAAAVKKETTQASCRRSPPHPAPTNLLLNFLSFDRLR